MTIRVYGAGMSGLMAAQMMRRHQPIVLEAQLKLPDNHGALLRFRSNVVGKAVGQRLIRVEVQKAIKVGGVLLPGNPTLADSNRYSLKVSGEAMARSVLSLSGGERYIAPDDFLTQLGAGINIQFGAPLTEEEVRKRTPDSDPVISTIPMPVLAGMVGGSHGIDFRFRSIWSVRADLAHPPTRIYQTIYYPEGEPYYRASITGSQLIIEYAQEPGPGSDIVGDAYTVSRDFGFDGVTLNVHDAKFQKYGKLLPIPEQERQRFILAMSDHYNIYSLGRFATWRQILLDDVVHDVEVIEKFIEQRSGFSRQRHWL